MSNTTSITALAAITAFAAGACTDNIDSDRCEQPWCAVPDGKGDAGGSPWVQTVEANGIELAYLEAGHGPLVILLHGFPDTPYTWSGVAPRLVAAGYHVVAPFLRGYAPSAIPPTDTTTTTLGRDVLALATALGEDQVILVGHDWGATAAYAAAALDPARVAKLVTIAIPHPIALAMHPEVPLPPHFMELVQPDATERVQEHDLRYIDELIARWSPTWDVPAGEANAVKRTFRVPGSLNAALGYYRAVTAGFPPEAATPLPMPSLTFHGSDDHAITQSVFADQHRGYSGQFELVSLPTGHFVQREAESEFVAKLLAFLQGQAAHE